MTQSTEKDILELPFPPRTDLAGLEEAFAAFTETTSRLEEAHRMLALRVAQVDRELEEKNRELEEANVSLEGKIEELDRMRGYLDAVIESMEDGLVSVDPEGRVQTVNRAAEAALGLDRGTVRGTFFSLWLGEQASQSLRKALERGTRTRGAETRLFRANEDKPLPVRYSAAPITDSGGEKLGALFIFQDLTEIRLLEEKVRRQDRLAALGELAAGVAHEMRNPLTTIRGFIQLIPRQAGDPEFLEDMTGNVLREIDRLAMLTEDLLGLSRPIGECLAVENATALLEEVVTFYSDPAGQATPALEPRRLETDLPVRMDRDRLRQVFLNIFVNACQAAGTGGRVRYGAERLRGRIQEGREETDLARLWIADSGPGISPDILPRLFDPFFTTKEKGTGLGLTLSHRIVEEHGGVIRAESDGKNGAEFSVYLPIEKETAE